MTSPMTSLLRRTVVVSVVVALTGAGAAVSAQRGGRGGGTPTTTGAEIRSRMEILTDIFTLDKDQRKAIKESLDGHYKNSAVVRAALKKARTDLGAAVVANKPQPEIDAAVKAYADATAAMADLEMKALADLRALLTTEQQPKIQPAFNLMRGIFLDDKKWDEIPEIRAY